MAEPEYVTNGAWMRPSGRPDAIDEIADQFERPAEAPSFAAVAERGARWPTRSRGWLAAGHRSEPEQHQRAS